MMLSELLQRQAADYPNRLAFRCGDDGLTWSVLLERTARLSAGLASVGIARDTRVGVALPNSLWLVTAILALARLGAQTVLLGTDLTAAELAGLVEQGGWRTLIADDRFSGTMHRLLVEKRVDRSIQTTPSDVGMPSLASLSAAAPIARDPDSSCDAPFLHLLTSGTTGHPKRVIRTQRALCALASNYCRTVRLTADDRVFAVIPLNHGYGLCYAFLAPLHSGATTILASHFDRRETLRTLVNETITIFSASPFVYSILAETGRREGFRCPALRLPLVGGAPLDRRVWYTVRDQLGVRMRQQYGATEAGVVAINMDESPEASFESVGQPIADVDVAIWDAAGHQLPVGAQGRIAVRSPGAAQWAAQIGDADAGLVRLADDRGWILLNDEGRLDGRGQLFVTGRTTAVVNVGGRKVDPAEVEAVFLSHDKVEHVTLVPVTDAYGNETTKALVFCSGPCQQEELVAFCHDRLSAHKIPRLIEVRSSFET